MRVEVLVTGGSSPLGDVVLPRLVQDYGAVGATVRSNAAKSRVVAAGAVPIECDLTDIPDLNVSSDSFVHLAGVGFNAAAASLIRISGASRAVAISSASAAEVGHPRSQAVRAAEEKFMQLVVGTSILRPTMIYGSPRERSISRIVSMCRRAPAVPRVTGGGLLMPVFVDDVATAIIETLRGAPTNAATPVGGPVPLRLGGIVDSICELLNRRRIDVAVPLGAPVALANRFGSPTSKLVHAVQMLERDRLVPTPEAAGFQYQPTQFDDGLEVAVGRYETRRTAAKL